MPAIDVKIVLVRPRNPLNIGACARAMANFGFRKLVVVSPYAPVWKEVSDDSESALTSAVGARDVIGSAEVSASLSEAVADRQLVFATTAMKNRVPDRPAVMLPELNAFISSRWPQGQDLKVAVVFGPEKTGLTNKHISRAHATLSIPTCDQTPSMNLGQATAVCCYELSKAAASSKPGRLAQGQEFIPPACGDVEAVVADIDELFVKIGYQNGTNPEVRQEYTRRALLGATLAKSDIYAIRSIVGRLLGRGHASKKENAG